MNAKKLDSVVDGKLPNDQYSMSSFNKVIVHKLSGSYRGDLYLRCRMNFVGDVVQTKAPQFVGLGLLDINTLNESGVVNTTATRIQRSVDISHLSAPDNVFGGATAVGMKA